MSDELDYLLSTYHGEPSLTIWSVMMGAKIPREKAWGHMPPDHPATFQKCHKLLEKFPDWRARFHEVSAMFPHWKPFVDGWDRLIEMYDDFDNEDDFQFYKALLRLKCVSGIMQKCRSDNVPNVRFED